MSDTHPDLNEHSGGCPQCGADACVCKPPRDPYRHFLRYFVLFGALTAGNFFAQLILGVDGDFSLAADRSFFQAIAIIMCFLSIEWDAPERS